MSLFRKHHKEPINFEYKYPIPSIKKRESFFLSLDALTRQAEFHFENKNFELSEGIFELMIRHIEKNKSIRFIDSEDLENIIVKSEL